jgi:hypothetical protein
MRTADIRVKRDLESETGKGDRGKWSAETSIRNENGEMSIGR